MNLTTEQLKAFEKGDPVHLEINGKPCVILQEEAYDRVKNLLEYDDSPLTPAEQEAAFLEAGKLAGWDDPAMDIYNDLDPRK